MRSRRYDDTAHLAPSAAGAEENSALALLHSATTAILSPMTRNLRTSAAEHEHDDDEEEDEEVLADDGLSSSSDEEYEDALRGDERDVSPPEMSAVETAAKTVYSRGAGLPSSYQAKYVSHDRISKTAALLKPSQKDPRTRSRQASLPGYFDRPTRHEQGESPGLSVPATPGGTRRRPIFKRNKSATPSRRSTKDFNFDANQGKDVLGIVMVEIESAADLPKIKNCEGTSCSPDLI